MMFHARKSIRPMIRLGVLFALVCTPLLTQAQMVHWKAIDGGWCTLIKMPIPAWKVADANPSSIDPAPVDTSSPTAASEEGFQPLFNGKDLDGWLVQGLEKAGPTIEPDGVLKVGGWDYWAIITQEPFKNFVLRFDVKFEEKGNSGVLIHTLVTKPKLEVYKKESFEIQLNADSGEVSPKCTGSLFTPKGVFLSPKINPTKPIGEWNWVEIQYAGKKLTLIINGQSVYDSLDMTQFSDLKLNDAGNLAIQRNDYKKAAWFRNIRIKRLPD